MNVGRVKGAPCVGERMSIVTVNLGKRQLALIKSMIDEGITTSRSEFVRAAVDKALAEMISLANNLTEFEELGAIPPSWKIMSIEEYNLKKGGKINGI